MAIRHLQKRGGRFYFKRRIPKDLRSIFRQEHIVKSLLTDDYSSAKTLISEWVKKTNNLFTVVRSGILSQSEIYYFILKFFNDNELSPNLAISALYYSSSPVNFSNFTLRNDRITYNVNYGENSMTPQMSKKILIDELWAMYGRVWLSLPEKTKDHFDDLDVGSNILSSFANATSLEMIPRLIEDGLSFNGNNENIFNEDHQNFKEYTGYNKCEDIKVVQGLPKYLKEKYSKDFLYALYQRVFVFNYIFLSKIFIDLPCLNWITNHIHDFLKRFYDIKNINDFDFTSVIKITLPENIEYSFLPAQHSFISFFNLLSIHLTDFLYKNLVSNAIDKGVFYSKSISFMNTMMAFEKGDKSPIDDIKKSISQKLKKDLHISFGDLHEDVLPEIMKETLEYISRINDISLKMSGKLPLSKYEICSEQHSIKMSNTSEQKAEIKLSGVKLSQAIENFRREKKIKKKHNHRVTREMPGMTLTILELLGDKDVSLIGDDELLNLLEDLQKVPSRFRNNNIFKGKTAREAINMKTNKPVLAIATINKYMTWAHGIFDLLQKKGTIISNPAKDMQMSKDKPADAERSEFTTKDLLRLFHSPVYERTTDLEKFKYFRKKGAHIYWIPLIGLFTGIRLGNIAGARLNDFMIHEEKKIPFIKVMKDSKGKSVKSKYGLRTIPISPILVKLGLFEYIDKLKKKGEKRLFPELKLTPGIESYGHNYSSTFSKKIRDPYLAPFIEKGEKVSFHSFRHTLTTELFDCGVDVFKITTITGHEPPSRSSVFRYIKKKNIETKYNAIKPINFGIDFEKEVPTYEEWMKD